MSAAAVPVNAEPDLDTLCTSFPHNSRCEGYEPTFEEDGREVTADGYRIVNEGDWRTAFSSGRSIPWSEPVMVRDDFDGDYLAVLDRNYDGSLTWGNKDAGVISNWSRNYIRVVAYTRERQCGFWSCNTNETVQETSRLRVKVGDTVYNLEGVNGNFPVSEELAAALRNAPPGEAKIRISIEGSGASIDNDIGLDTVEAWRVVYAAE
ncbi:hypothetical protein [Synechococcus sp. PCC 7336]|uniref:hypothetical protein n=1 Tax=Synechococcus sp. PCC 7336 TaxID=195250 RepID=UPI000570C98F|nr:hypothetical protein [Synechococcus sp. PCC 7336]